MTAGVVTLRLADFTMRVAPICLARCCLSGEEGDHDFVMIEDRSGPWGEKIAAMLALETACVTSGATGTFVLGRATSAKLRR